MQTKRREVAIFLCPEFEWLELGLIAGILGSAGRKWNFAPYHFELLSSEGGKITSAQQLSADTTALHSFQRADILILLGGYGSQNFEDPAALALLNDLAKPCELLIAVSGGNKIARSMSHLSADEQLHLSKEANPSQAESYIGSRFFSAPSTGHLDSLCFELIARHFGKGESNRLREWLNPRQHAMNPIVEGLLSQLPVKIR